MRKIVFIGQLQNIEFASRWRKELVPEQVAAGKLIAKYRYEGDTNKLDPLLYKVSKQGKQIRAKLNIDKTSIKSMNTRLLSAKVEGNTIYIKESINSSGKEKLKKLKSAYRKRKITATIGKAKNFIGKNKVGLVGAGLLTAGAIGYSLYRKKRNDKGKKRGNYRK